MVVSTQRTRNRQRNEPCDPRSIERGVRQLLADKVSGTTVGLWLLLPEYMRLGTWELLCGWCGQSGEGVEPRLALQLINEAALCVNGVRDKRSLGQRGFEAACGLPFIATDCAIHNLLDQHTVEEARELQVALGMLRRQRGDFQGDLLAIDPHRIASSSKRRTRLFKAKNNKGASKQVQTFFCLDADTQQPLAFTMGTASRTAGKAAMDLMDLAGRILPQTDHRPLILADAEHYSAALFDYALDQSPFDLLVPQPSLKSAQRAMAKVPQDQWNKQWAGYATATGPFRFKKAGHELYQLIEREGEREQEYRYNGFLATAPRDEMTMLTQQYPSRWHIEQFFDTDQHLGWGRAGTLNLNIRYAHMTMGLLAQAAIHRMRERLGPPFSQWEAPHLARGLFTNIDGDIRVHHNTVIVTLYNTENLPAPIRQHYTNLPEKLREEGVCPKIPWLYDLELDFRFK